MKETPWSRIRGQNSVNKVLSEIVGSGKPTGSVLKETIAVSVTISISVQSRHSRTLLRALLRGRMKEMHREPEVPEAGVPVEECFDCPARITSKELAPIHSVKNGILQNACFTSRRMDANLGKCCNVHRKVEEQPGKSSKKNGDKSAVATLKSTRQLGCVCQDVEPPKSSSILRRSSNIRKPIRCVQFTKAVARHANISRPKSIAWNDLPR